MQISYYVDADILGLAKLLVAVRSDVTFPGDPGGLGVDGFQRPPCSIDVNETDSTWIPKVSHNNWIIITRDKHMRHRPAEYEAIVRNKARVVRLDARRELKKWDQLEIIVCQWRNIEKYRDREGPWILEASVSKLSEQKL